MAPAVQFQDDVATGDACAEDAVKVFRADGVGSISRNRLVVSYPDGGGCGLQLVAIAGGYDYKADTDTLLDADVVTWTRVPEGADPARARTSGGTGLGLAIALEDTHLHGGWLQAWGKPAEGAQFRLTLPRYAGHPLRHSPLPLVPDDAAEVVA